MMRRILQLVCAESWTEVIFRGAFRKESHAHRGRCAGSRTARDIAQDPLRVETLMTEGTFRNEK